MTLSGYLLFLSVYALAVASPGPAVAAVIARALSHGARRSLPFIAGVTLGDLVWFWLSAAGLAVLAERFHLIFLAVKYAGVVYLLWLAVRLWRAPAVVGAPPEQARGEGLRLFLGGLSLTMGNPKVMVFFLAILPNLIDVGRVSPAIFTIASATIVVVLPAILTGYALLAARARRLIASGTAQRRLNRASAMLMAGAAAAVAAK